MVEQLITSEKFVNIQKAQAGLTRLLQTASKTDTFYRVLRNDQPLGVLVPENLWQSFAEDLEALSSLTFRRRIAKARAERGSFKAAAIKKQLKL